MVPKYHLVLLWAMPYYVFVKECVQLTSMVKMSLMMKRTYSPLCTYFCAGFMSSLIMSDKLCSWSLSSVSSGHFTCTLWLFNRPNLKLAPPTFLSFSFSASPIFLYMLIYLLFPLSKQFGFHSFPYEITSFPVQAPFIRLDYLVD